MPTYNKQREGGRSRESERVGKRERERERERGERGRKKEGEEKGATVNNQGQKYQNTHRANLDIAKREFNEELKGMKVKAVLSYMVVFWLI